MLNEAESQRSGHGELRPQLGRPVRFSSIIGFAPLFAANVQVGKMRGILWTVALMAVVLLSVSLLSYYWLHWLAR